MTLLILACALTPLSALGQTKNVRVLRGGALDMSITGLGAAYASSLSANPILTKSFTSGAIFALSDVTGQAIDGSTGGRDTSSALLRAGLLASCTLDPRFTTGFSCSQNSSQGLM